MELTDEQLAMIMEYAGEKQEESHLSEEAAACVTAYLKDVEAVDLDLAGKKELFAAFRDPVCHQIVFLSRDHETSPPLRFGMKALS